MHSFGIARASADPCWKHGRRLASGPSFGGPTARHAVYRDMFFTRQGETPAEQPLGSGRTLRMARLEAILFLAREPLPTRKLSQFANLADGTEARTLIRQLNQWYDTQGCAFRVEQTAGGYRLLTRPKFANWVRRLAHVPEETRLSSPALETLALVAYRQPILRADIEAIRGVSCGEILRQLMDRDLVRICGRSEELGRPYLYGTTKPFLLLFGLKDLDDLPRADSLRGTGLTSLSTAHSLLSDSPETELPQEENLVTATATLAPATEEEFGLLHAAIPAADVPRADTEDDDLDSDDDVDDDDDDEDDDFDDLDDDDDDDDEEDLDDEEDDEFDDWEEVDDEDEDEDEADDEADDDEWDDDAEEDDEEDDDDDWDDDDDDDEEEEDLDDKEDD